MELSGPDADRAGRHERGGRGPCNSSRGRCANTTRWCFDKFGRDKGADIPAATEYVRALRPLLSKYGNEPNFTLILFTLDETVFTRELAPLAGHFPSVKLGPPWWFLDSPEGMMRFRETATETAASTTPVRFNDDTQHVCRLQHGATVLRIPGSAGGRGASAG